jgi:hydrogenase-4 component F
MWIAVEATTLSTAFLISFYNKPTDIEAAWKYLIINSVGLLLGLLGTLIYLALYSVSSNTDFVRWNDLIAAAPSLPTGIIKFGFIFIVIGYGTKLGLVPMHTWRPDAYSRAPVPVVTLLSGALLNVALLAILRFKMITDAAVGTGFSSSVFIFMGVITLVFVGLIMLTQRNYRRMLAYSSIEHAGMMMLGFGFGGIGIFAAFLHSIYHAIAKSILFLGAGNINMKYDSAEFKDIKGVLSKMPITAIATLFGFIAITGIPPLGIFMTKFYVILTAFSHAPFIAAIMLVSLVLVFIGMFKAIFHMVFDQGPTTIPAGEINVWTIAPLVVAMVLLAILSVYIPDTLRILLNDAVHLFN